MVTGLRDACHLTIRQVPRLTFIYHGGMEGRSNVVEEEDHLGSGKVVVEVRCIR